MTPKTLTRLLAAGGLGCLAALHWVPKKFLPFESHATAAALVVGVLVAVHRNPLRMLYRDARKALENSMKESGPPTMQLVTHRTVFPRL